MFNSPTVTVCLRSIFPVKVAGWVYVLHKPQYYLFCKLPEQLTCAYWQCLQTSRDDRYGWGEAGLGKRLKGGKGEWGRAIWIWKCGCFLKPGVKLSRFLFCTPSACLPSLAPQSSRGLVECNVQHHSPQLCQPTHVHGLTSLSHCPLSSSHTQLLPKALIWIHTCEDWLVWYQLLLDCCLSLSSLCSSSLLISCSLQKPLELVLCFFSIFLCLSRRGRLE